MPNIVTITTSKIGPTDNTGEEIKAKADTGETLTRPHTYELHGVEAHADVAQRLAAQIFPAGHELHYSTATGSGYRFVARRSQR